MNQATLQSTPPTPSTPPPPPPRRTPRTPAPRRLEPPTLRFTAYAWAKLLWFRDRGETEIGGFGVSSPEDLLLIEDFVTVLQQTSSVTVEFDDEAVADFYERQFELGRKPQQFSRLWLHTHPGDSAQPSGTDEATFERVFGRCDWAVMAILAKGGQTYARLRFGVGPGGQMMIPVEVDCTAPFPASDHAGWDAEYLAHVHPALSGAVFGASVGHGPLDDALWLDPMGLGGEFDPDDLHDLRQESFERRWL